MDKILLIDAMNAIFRASIVFGVKHALCDKGCYHHIDAPHCVCGKLWLQDKCSYDVDPKDTIVYNFFKNLRPLVEKFSPHKIYIAFEGHPKARYEIFPEYKANRLIKLADPEKKATRDTVIKAANIIKDLLKYLQVTIVKAEDHEADDVISTLCDNLKDEDLTIISSDSDYTQLLQKNYKNIKIYNPIKKDFVKAPEFPYVFWKALVGDVSDNIPGFKGVGKKTAEKLLKSPKQLEQFLSLEENRANFNIYRKLIEFQKIPEEDLILIEGVKDFEYLYKEFSAMKFETIINEFAWSKFCKTFICIKF